MEDVMAGPEKHPLSPMSKDPAEGARGPAEGGDPKGERQESHLGRGGDPAEGRRDANVGEANRAAP
jgi:hypothetical protein